MCAYSTTSVQANGMLSLDEGMTVKEAHLVSQAFEEGSLELGDEWLEAWACLGNEQADGVQQGCLDLPRQAVTNDPDHGACKCVWCKRVT